jgi:hypothetical protein
MLPIAFLPDVRYNIYMPPVTRNIRDIDQTDRSTLERLVGVPLREDQQVVIQVLDSKPPVPPATNGTYAKLPPWCNVFEGLTTDEKEDLTSSIVRLPTSRPQRALRSHHG